MVGTFTLKPRGSNWTKLYRLLKTTRPVESGWVNNVGFQNPGITSVKKFDSEKLYSIAAMEHSDWDQLLNIIPAHAMVEINTSCPNIDDHPEIPDDQVRKYLEKHPLVVFKLPPKQETVKEVEKLSSLGAIHFHLCNTMPTERGGESGKRLQELSLDLIRETKKIHPHIKIIGGGGIYEPKDIDLYRAAGADFFSLASVFLNPLKAQKLLRSI